MLRIPTILACTGALLAACAQEPPGLGHGRQIGVLENPALDETSGLQFGRRNPGVVFMHNDDGPARLFAVGEGGQDLGSFEISGAANRDWEDITAVPSASGPLLVAADTGDNLAQRDAVSLYFAAEPAAGENGRFQGAVPLFHAISLRYPDGARDCESVAYDPSSQRILLMSKRDKPPRLYAIDLATALSATAAELAFVGEAHRFREPTARDMRVFGQRDGRWVSQPTGMDISEDGSAAVVISYRSLYLFRREPGEDWAQAFSREPVEFKGPPSLNEEAVGIGPGARWVLVTTEGIPAPLYRLELDTTVP